MPEVWGKENADRELPAAPGFPAVQPNSPGPSGLSFLSQRLAQWLLRAALARCALCTSSQISYERNEEANFITMYQCRSCGHQWSEPASAVAED